MREKTQGSVPDIVSSSLVYRESTIDAKSGTKATSNVPIPIPNAKCGSTKDVIEFACGI